MTPPELAHRLVAGEQAALAELYDLMATRVFSLALSVAGDTRDAEEVVSDTFLQVWNARDSFDASRGSIEAWVVTMARSRALDRRRARDRRGDIRQDVGRDYFQFGNDSRDLVTETLARTDASRAIGEALGKLPPEQRRAVELAYFEGYTQTEIAEETGTPLGTVKTRIRTAMQKLRAAVGVTGEETR